MRSKPYSAARRGPRTRWAARTLGSALLVLLVLAPAVPVGASPSPPAATVGGPALASTGVVVDPAAAPPPAVEVGSYVVADVETGDVLAARAAHAPYLPASTLKVLTALTLLPVLDTAEVVAGSAEAAAVEGSKAGIEPGLQYSIDLVFKAMMMQSGNDAAVTLALAAGGVPQTVARMNAVARDLNALDTVAANPSGLDAPGQVTSAYDLALITRAALQREDFRAYITTPTADMPDRDGGTYQIQNENRFLAGYDGAIGVKNGYTTLARHTFVGAAERNGRTLVVTVMRTEARPETVVSALMDWGFANAGSAEPVGELVEPGVPLPAATDDAGHGSAASGAPPAGAAVGAGALDVDAAGAPRSDAGGGGDTGGGGGGSWLEAAGLGLLALAVVVVGLRARVLWRQRQATVGR